MRSACILNLFSPIQPRTTQWTFYDADGNETSTPQLLLEGPRDEFPVAVVPVVLPVAFVHVRCGPRPLYTSARLLLAVALHSMDVHRYTKKSEKDRVPDRERQIQMNTSSVPQHLPAHSPLQSHNSFFISTQHRTLSNTPYDDLDEVLSATGLVGHQHATARVTLRHFEARKNCSSSAAAIAADVSIVAVIAIVESQCRAALEDAIGPSGVPLIFWGQGLPGELGRSTVARSFVMAAPARKTTESLALFLAALDWPRPVLVTDVALTAEDVKAYNKIQLARNVVYNPSANTVCDPAAEQAALEIFDARSPMLAFDMFVSVQSERERKRTKKVEEGSERRGNWSEHGEIIVQEKEEYSRKRT